MRKENLLNVVYIGLMMALILLVMSLFFMSEAVSESSLNEEELKSMGLWSGFLQVLGFGDEVIVNDSQRPVPVPYNGDDVKLKDNNLTLFLILGSLIAVIAIISLIMMNFKKKKS